MRVGTHKESKEVLLGVVREGGDVAAGGLVVYLVHERLVWSATDLYNPGQVLTIFSVAESSTHSHRTHEGGGRKEGERGREKDTVRSSKQDLACQQLGHNATHRPDISYRHTHTHTERECVCVCVWKAERER